MTDAEIIAIRDSMLPSQGEAFDTLAFGRALVSAERDRWLVWHGRLGDGSMAGLSDAKYRQALSKWLQDGERMAVK